MLRKPAHLIFYLSTLQKSAAGAGFCNLQGPVSVTYFKYKSDTFYLGTIQKPAPDAKIMLIGNHCISTNLSNLVSEG